MKHIIYKIILLVLVCMGGGLLYQTLNTKCHCNPDCQCNPCECSKKGKCTKNCPCGCDCKH